MKKNSMSLWVTALVFLLCAMSVAAQKLPLADPFILCHDGLYYAYGTSDDNGIAVYTSEDLLYWTRQPVLALHKNDSYADRWFWAPEVYFLNGIFYMYYSADEHICVATSNSPLGPFVQNVKTPMLSDKAIDHSLFIDDNGKPYLFFVRFTDGNAIWMAELENDYKTVKTATMRLCFAANTSGWEAMMAKVVEGPFVVKHKGYYYLTYSANHYESKDYAVGYAYTSNITGTWTKYSGNPILRRPNGLVGTGHHSLFHDNDNNLRMVFHAHRDAANIHPRETYITSVGFTTQSTADIMTVNTNWQETYIVDRYLPNGRYRVESKSHAGRYISMGADSNSGTKVVLHQGDYLDQELNFERQGDGSYIITSSLSNKVLDLPAGNPGDGIHLQQWDWLGGDPQRWYVIDHGGGYVELVSKASLKAVDIKNNDPSNGTPIQTWPRNYADAQRFRLVPLNLPAASMNLPDGTYKMEGKTSGKFVTLGISTANGHRTFLHDGDGLDQHLKFERQSDGTYKITSSYSNKVLDVSYWKYAEGTQLSQYDWHGGINQRWYVVDCGDGYVKLISKFNGQILDVNNNGTANGTAIQQWGDNGSGAQRFVLRPVTSTPQDPNLIANGLLKVKAVVWGGPSNDPEISSVPVGNLVALLWINDTNTGDAVTRGAPTTYICTPAIATVSSSGSVSTTDNGMLTIKVINNGREGLVKLTVGEPVGGIAVPAEAKNEIGIYNTNTGIIAYFNGEAIVELYTITGMLIERTQAVHSYSRSLNNGAYIIRINGQTMKFVK